MEQCEGGEKFRRYERAHHATHLNFCVGHLSRDFNRREISFAMILHYGWIVREDYSIDANTEHTTREISEQSHGRILAHTLIFQNQYYVTIQTNMTYDVI